MRYFKSAHLQKLLGDISVCINNIRYRNEQEYQFFASPIKAFMMKYYDFSWLDQLRKQASDIYTLDIINRYRKAGTSIESSILNVNTLDRSEACNMIVFYKQMMISTQSLQLNNYILTNHHILQALREDYPVEKE